MTADPSALEPLSLYVSALAGRSLGLCWHDESHGLSYCDGVVIAVAAVRCEAAWIDVTLQALLVRAGSLSTRSMQQLVGRPTLARSYLACELARGLTQAQRLAPRAVIDHAALTQLPPAPANRAASLQRARELRLATTPTPWGVLMPLKVLARRASGSTQLDDDATLEDTTNGEPEAAVSPCSTPDAEREPEDSAILDALRSPVASTIGPLGRLLSSLFIRERAERVAAIGGATGETQISEGAWLGTNRRRRVFGGHARTAETAAPIASTMESSYPEWDEWAGRYRPNFVRVAEVDPDPDAALEPTAAACDSRALRRALARLALGYEQRRHQQQGDELDVDALVQLRADLASDSAGDPRIYSAPMRTKRDLSALLLLDISGSTAERTAEGPRVFDRQLGFALSLTEALLASGDRTSLYAFHSWGPKIVRLVRLLDFDARSDASLIERARRIAPIGYSRLGAAIRHGAHLLRERAGTSHRLLIIVSDALAYDQGYEGRYAHADTRRALSEARGENIACVCLSIAASTEEPALQQVFGGSCFLALPELAGHEKVLRRLFESALTAVTRQAAPA